MKNIAIVCAKGLGDGLISSILSHNFFLSGHRVTLFSNALQSLKSWFPHQEVFPFPPIVDYLTTFSSFDLVIAADHSILSNTSLPLPDLVVLKEAEFDKKKTMVENLSNVSRNRFFLPHSHKINGITAPSHLTHQKFPKRIIIHPTSTHVKRNWPAEKFLKLAKKLHEAGWEPAFCMSLHERIEWESLLEKNPEILFPKFGNLEELAAYVYESGWHIGNDSGIGHLASNLHIPTLSIFARKSYSRLWRPGWSEGKVVTPYPLLIGKLKQAYWKGLLPSTRVVNAFKKMALTVSRNAPTSKKENGGIER